MTESLQDIDAVAELGNAAEGPPAVQRPEHLPEKFWDAENGAVRTEALARSYVELERKLGRTIPLPDPADGDDAGLDKLLAILGRPATPEDYVVEVPHPLVTPDAALNGRLHAAGFTQKQVELVYQLAAERLIPTLQSGMADIEAERQATRLEQHFGGSDAWRETARQLKSWAAASLPDEVAGTLVGSYEGVLALHQMMQATEPKLRGIAEGTAEGGSESALHEMMRDPRYWREREPEFVSRVSAGFRRLYPD